MADEDGTEKKLMKEKKKPERPFFVTRIDMDGLTEYLNYTYLEKKKGKANRFLYTLFPISIYFR